MSYKVTVVSKSPRKDDVHVCGVGRVRWGSPDLYRKSLIYDHR